MDEYIPKRPEDAGFSKFYWRYDRGVPLQVQLPPSKRNNKEHGVSQVARREALNAPTSSLNSTEIEPLCLAKFASH